MHLAEAPRVVKFRERDSRPGVVRNWQDKGLGSAAAGQGVAFGGHDTSKEQAGGCRLPGHRAYRAARVKGEREKQLLRTTW